MKRIELMSLSLVLLFVFCVPNANALEVFGIELGGKKAQVKEEPQKPLPPKYVKISMGGEKPQIVSVKYEATEGTASGYDTVYYANGATLDPATAKKLTTTPKKSSGRVTCEYKPCNLLVNDENDAEKKDGCQVTFCHCRSSARDTFCITAVTKANGGGSVWEYSSRGPVKVSDSLEKAKVTPLLPAPNLSIQTKPDLNQKGHLGVALNMASSDRTVVCKKDGNALDAEVVIKTTEGKVVHKATDKLDKFAFG